MADTKSLIKLAYSAFNQQDTDGARAPMTEDVMWPKRLSRAAESWERKREAGTSFGSALTQTITCKVIAAPRGLFHSEPVAEHDRLRG